MTTRRRPREDENDRPRDDRLRFYRYRRDSDAHQLDEYLQATRVSLSRNRVGLEIDLTPGATIAPDRSCATRSRRRQRDFADRGGGVRAARPGRSRPDVGRASIATTLTHAEVAPIESLRSGIGVIQLRAVGDLDSDATGSREVYFRNNHRAGHQCVFGQRTYSRRSGTCV